MDDEAFHHPHSIGLGSSSSTFGPALNSTSYFSQTSTSPLPRTPEKKTTYTLQSMSMVAQSMGAMEASKKLDISNLMSPPELPPFDTFVQTAGASVAMGASLNDRSKLPNIPLSPPVSPCTSGSNSVEAVASGTISINDPILYPTSESATRPQPPLFNSEAVETINAARRLVDEHVANRPASLFREASPPRDDEYVLALHFRSQVMKKYSENPASWLQKERAQLIRDRAAGARLHSRSQTVGGRSLPALLPAAAKSTPQLQQGSARTAPIPRIPRTNQENRVTKRTSPAPRPIRAANNIPAVVSAVGPPTVTGAAPRQQAIRMPSATPEPRRIVAPNREDKDFGSLVNYCPPIDSLPNRPNSLKVDWKGQPIDVSGDPLSRLLHPDEQLLAANLRLDCATYLTSKRRIFIRRLECARTGKEFRKTDAQQACKIDVNKASKLWTAFEKVGWLEIDWMRPFLKGGDSGRAY